MESLVGMINEVMWTPLYILIFLIGIYFTFRSKFLQFTSVRKVWRFLLGKDHAEESSSSKEKKNEVSFAKDTSFFLSVA